MKFTTLIPTYLNNGKPVAQSVIESIIRDFWVYFGGCSIDGPIRGHWVDEKSGDHYEDECLRITVVCDNSRLADAEMAVKQIGRQLEQEAMYFEVRDFDGVRFLRIEKER